MRNSRKSLPEVMKNIFRQQYAGVLHSRKARSAMRGRLSDDTRQHVWHYRKACFASPKAPFRTTTIRLPEHIISQSTDWQRIAQTAHFRAIRGKKESGWKYASIADIRIRWLPVLIDLFRISQTNGLRIHAVYPPYIYKDAPEHRNIMTQAPASRLSTPAFCHVVFAICGKNTTNGFVSIRKSITFAI